MSDAKAAEAAANGGSRQADAPPPPYESVEVYPKLPGPPPTNEPIQLLPSAAGSSQPAPTVTVTVVQAGNCPGCARGNMTKEFNMCCIVVIILCAVILFPIGLICLCCLPCAQFYRCPNCRRKGKHTIDGWILTDD